MNIIDELLGAGDTALAVVSPIVAEPFAGWAGIMSGGDPEAVRYMQERMTWAPKTEEGMRNLGVLGEGIQSALDYQPPLRGQSIGQDLQDIGDYWRDTSVPALQETFGDELGSGIGAAGLGVLSTVGLPARAGRRISTRYPTAVNATENPLTENLIIDTESMMSGPRAFKNNMQAMSKYPQLSTPLRNPEKRAEYFTGVLSDNLVDMYDRIPSEVRDVSKDWYVGANRFANTMADRYNQSPESVSGVIAALSPQKDWYMNASLAERMLDINADPGDVSPDMLEAARRIFADEKFSDDMTAVASKPYNDLTQRQKAMFVRLKDEAHNYRGHRIMSPRGDFLDFAKTGAGADKKTGWGSLAEIGKGISVLEDPSVDNISRQMGGMHKVRNFYNNIIDPYSPDGDVTIDTHAVAAGLLSPYSGNSVPVTHNFGGVGSSSFAGSGAKGTYGLYADAYRDAANKAGVLPREMQSITWEGVRGLFPAAFKQGKNVEDIDRIWQSYKRGDLTMDQAREEVYGRAGGISNPDWDVSRPNTGPSGGAPTSTYKGKLSGDSVPSTGGVDGGIGSSAARLSATGESGFVDPSLLKWLALLGGGAYIGSGMLSDDVEESEAAQAFRPRQY